MSSVITTTVIPSSINADLVSQFICHMLTLQPYIHFCHLTEKSYARHVALGEFYSELPDLADKLAEACLSYPITIKYDRAIGQKMPEESLRDLVYQGTELHKHFEQVGQYGLTNQLEDVLTLTHGTLYKLTRLS